MTPLSTRWDEEGENQTKRSMNRSLLYKFHSSDRGASTNPDHNNLPVLHPKYLRQAKDQDFY